METTTVSVGKSVLNGAVHFATSAIAEEVTLQLGVQRDKAFVTDELEMMQSFLMVAHDERDDHNKVIKTWVKQVRDVAYDVEDVLQDFVVRLQKKQSWWRIPHTILNRRQVAKQMKELRTKVEEVSQRNMRYGGLLKGSRSTELAATAIGQSSSVAVSAMFVVDEARRHVGNQHQARSELDLAQLIINKEGLGSDQIGVVGVWQTSGTDWHTSILWDAYEDTNVKINFPCRAWVRVMRPFHPKEFIHSIVKQFRGAVGVTDALLELEEEKTGQQVAHEYSRYVDKKRYLIVLTDLSTIEEWHQIKTFLPENNLGSRIVVSTEQLEVASLCPGQERIVSKLKQLSADQIIYVFYRQSSQDITHSSNQVSTSTLRNIVENEIQDSHSSQDATYSSRAASRSTSNNETQEHKYNMDLYQLIGREKEKHVIIQLVREHNSTHQPLVMLPLKKKNQPLVIAVWGMPGLGKTALIKDVCQRQGVSDTFEKHAFVTVMRPFKREEVLRSLAMELDAKKNPINPMYKKGFEELTQELARLSEGKKCLIVLDDLSSTLEWDLIVKSLTGMKSSSLIIMITTRREDIAKHCCQKPECIFLLHTLQDKDAYDLFTRKVFKSKTTDMAKEYPELLEPAKLVLQKCDGLPLAIVTIGGFLAEQPRKSAVEWRKLNEQMSVELEMNPKFEPVRNVLTKSYNGLPYYLKSCFLYMSIFRGDRNVSRRRLVRRWVAEGYSRDSSVAERYFTELVERSMISSMQGSVFSREQFHSCQLHDLICDIISAESMEENLVFRLEEGCRSNTHGALRHLVISSNWEGDERELEVTVELSRIRSLTVFGKWRPFYISDKMKFLRVLDLEGIEGLDGHHLENIGRHLHLKYLSLRGCGGITFLPESVGNLRQLETLDIKYTRISELPKAITKLSKLRVLQAGSAYSVKRRTLEWCIPRCVCSWHHGSCASLPCYMENTIDLFGVNVPRGISKLKTLRTLRSVHLAWGNAIMPEIQGLTGLRKLGVFGIDTSNGPEFCSAISSLSSLESLSVRSEEGDLYDCLHAMSSPPENLESLKLYGCLKKLPEWIKGLQNLEKLKLDTAELRGNAETVQVLGNLPNLSILRLQVKSFQSEGGPISFQSGLFRSLVALHLSLIDVEVEALDFELASMPMLEVLSLQLQNSKTRFFSGLEFLRSIKEVRLSIMIFIHFVKQTENMTGEEAKIDVKRREHEVRENIEEQLAANQNRPLLKVLCVSDPLQRNSVANLEIQ